MADIAGEERDTRVTEGGVDQAQGPADSVFRRYPLQAVMTGLIVASFPGRKGGK